MTGHFGSMKNLKYLDCRGRRINKSEHILNQHEYVTYRSWKEGKDWKNEHGAVDMFIKFEFVLERVIALFL